MDSEIAILIVSHGNFAKELLASAELIVGKQENVSTLGIDVIDNIQEINDEMVGLVNELNCDKGLLVFGDLFGGSPLNLAMQLLEHQDVIISSGINLPVLLEVLINRSKHISEIEDLIRDAYKNGLVIKTHADFIKEEEKDDYIL